MSRCFSRRKASVPTAVTQKDKCHHHECLCILPHFLSFYWLEWHHMSWNTPLVSLGWLSWLHLLSAFCPHPHKATGIFGGQQIGEVALTRKALIRKSQNIGVLSTLSSHTYKTQNYMGMLWGKLSLSLPSPIHLKKPEMSEDCHGRGKCMGNQRNRLGRESTAKRVSGVQISLQTSNLLVNKYSWVNVQKRNVFP